MACQYYIAKTFAHIGGGLVIAGASAMNPDLYKLIEGGFQGTPYLPFILTSLITVTSIFLMNVLPANTFIKYAVASFFAYMIGQLSGSFVQHLRQMNKLAETLFLTAGVFLGMVGIGTTDQFNLLGLSSYLMGGLLGLILCQMLLIIVRSQTEPSNKTTLVVSDALSFMAVGLFGLFVAFETQVLRRAARTCGSNPDYLRAAQSLFLNFMNLFTSIGSFQLGTD